MRIKPQSLPVKNPIVPGVLQWNRLNGSGPVSDRAFLKRNANLRPGDHNWIFAKGNRL